jgi:HPt (histidine-containing phosphotransfer) domain-containing protein
MHDGPIIATTAHGQNSDRERCFSNGIDGNAFKPAELDVVESAARTYRAPVLQGVSPVGAQSGCRVSGGERVLDPDILAQIRMLEVRGQPSLLAEIVDAFRASSENYRARLTGAVQVGDHKTVQDVAHALKGAAMSVGAERVRSIARELELRGRQQSLDGIVERLTALDNACEQVLAALTQEVVRAA